MKQLYFVHVKIGKVALCCSREMKLLWFGETIGLDNATNICAATKLLVRMCLFCSEKNRFVLYCYSLTTHSVEKAKLKLIGRLLVKLYSKITEFES